MQRTSERAVAQRQSIAVAALTTATSQVIAGPDGRFTDEINAMPVRVKQGGRWVPIDTTLRRGSDGVAATASSVPVTFSDGGAGHPLARLDVAGGNLQLSWPGRLSAPVVTGSAANYPDVLPGVDLRLTATSTGFGEVLVVKSRAAAADPALRHVAFGLSTRGLRVRSGADGSVDVVDGRGTVVLQSPPATMRAAGSSVDHPVATRLSGSSIILSPAVKFLQAPSTSYPVQIDPDFTASQTAWAKTFSGKPTDKYWNGGIDGAEAKSGQCYDDGHCNGIGVAETYFQYDLSALHNEGAIVEVMGLSITQTHAPNCSQYVTNLYLTGGIGPDTTWNSPPPNYGWLSNLGTGCVNQPYRFAINPTSAFGAAGIPATTLTMKIAANTGDQLNWRKWQSNPTLILTYNQPPRMPSGLTTQGQACQSQAGVTYVNPQLTTNGGVVTLAAADSDPDGDNVALTFAWYNGPNRISSAGTGFFGSGGSASTRVPASQLSDGETVGWNATATDGKNPGPTSGGCYFTVDETSPATAPTIASNLYPNGTTAGSVGQTGTFTLGANATGDVAGYRYGVSTSAGAGPTPNFVPASSTGGPATIQVTPSEFKHYTLTVVSVDRATNPGPAATYQIWPGLPTSPVDEWRLDGAQGVAGAPDSGRGPHHDGTLANFGTSTRWTPGRIGDAALFNGTSSSYINTTGGQAINTMNSFSVSAWVRLDKVGGYPAIVSEDSLRSPGFQLQATPDGHWAFAMFSQDVDGGGPLNDRIASTSSVQVGQWTQLVGTYDAAVHQIKLYVNGIQDGPTGSHNATWAATGNVSIGRTMWKGAPSDFFTGAIDDVKLFNRVLQTTSDPSDQNVDNVQALANQPLTQAAGYDFEETGIPVATDVSGNFNPATLSGGATRGDASDLTGTSNHAIELDGSTGYLATSGPVVRTDGSFTVSAWVNATKLDTAARTIVSQSGTQASNFYLQYRDDGGNPTWTFMLAGSDTATFTAYQASGGSPDTGDWHQLIGVYNAPAHEIELYVDGGSVQKADNVPANWNASGPLQIGRALYGGHPVDPWDGAIDEVHVYSGAMTDAQASAAASASVAPPVSVYTGEFTRWASDLWVPTLASSTGIVPAGYHFDAPMGWFVQAGSPAGATRSIYDCYRPGWGEFSSIDPACEGYQILGVFGQAYLNASEGTNLIKVLRCHTSTFYFDSLDPNCEGQGLDGPLGYLLPYAPLIRYSNPDIPDHWTSPNGSRLTGDYTPEGDFGVISMVPSPGTTTLFVCESGTDEFVSTDSTCGGKTVLYGSGFIWTSPPPGVHASKLLHECAVTSSGERFESESTTCEGQTVVGDIGWVVTAL